MSRTPCVEVDEGAVVLTTVKCTFVVSAEDLLRLLISNPRAWMDACKRGKRYVRAAAMTRRLGGDCGR